MRKIKNDKLLRHYVEKYNIYDIFDEDVYPYLQLHEFERNENILIAGENLEYYYLFVSGKIKISTLLENGRSVLLKFYKDFNFVGNAELLDNSPVICNVEAINDSHLIAIPTNILREKYVDKPKFLKHLVKSLSEKMIATQHNSSYNLMYPLVNRLASYLIEYITDDKDYIYLTSSLKEVSQFLGATYRHLSRTIKQLEDQGIIQSDRRTIYILDEDKLRALSKNIYI